MKPKIVLHSALAPDAVIETLRRSVDKEQRSLFFSMSGYKGDHPVLCKFEGSGVRLRKRRYDGNIFTPCLFAEFHPEPGGTRIEGYFDMAQWANLYMKFFFGVAVLLCVHILILLLLDLATGSHHWEGDGDRWAEVIAPPAMFAYGILVPKFCWWLGRGDKRYLLDFLQNTLAARIEGSASEIHLQSSR